MAQPNAEPETGAGWREFGPLELTPILDAALDEFRESGFHGATVRQIARRVGMTVPALYYHHENKEGLLVALLELGTSEVAWRVRAAADESPGRPREQFVSVIEAIVLHMAYRFRLAAIDSEMRYLSTSNRRRYGARRKAVENVLTEVIEMGCEDGTFFVDDPVETSRALLGMCQSVARWYHPDGPLSPEELAARYVDIALMTVGAHPRLQR
ncbi:TetR/AcrR family transcriptional regulator [Saccharopolyspora rhizosphaerae]|uniref:TetR/AcrR family transcriptional regulator n=1 Tax=Saccharopolyspora rhizosphaerae TaxID=2492662 RepID=A0A3R8VME7_9PSEU|nr:TetR/AcrR family transcriptional regulator [Saccharopolyspora rhizosphaerae]RRO20664.1 TetR/AcrR family transcriptional regulator [Saccharopolyspora rhizosphaerae]